MSDADDTTPADEVEIVEGGLPDLSQLGDVLGGAGGFGSLLEQAQQAMAAQAEAAAKEVEGVAGGGVVRIRATGTGQVLSVSIAPEAVDPDDVAMLEDLVLAALHDVTNQLGELQRQAMGPFGDLFGGG